MLRSTLIAQLLAFLLESQGADLDALREQFPEEFNGAFAPSLSETRDGHDSPGLSPVLNESLRHLLARHVIDVTPAGAITLQPTEAFSSAFEDGRGARTLLLRSDLSVEPAPDHVDALDFDQPRLED